MSETQSKWMCVTELSDGRRYLNGVEVEPEAYALILEATSHDKSASGQWVRTELRWNRSLSNREIELVHAALSKMDERV
jgi:hypothetical protein